MRNLPGVVFDVSLRQSDSRSIVPFPTRTGETLPFLAVLEDDTRTEINSFHISNGVPMFAAQK